jgi:hypothetical protein
MMLPYWQKKISEERLGQRLIGTSCENCGKTFFYLLTRVAKGHATAPYGIGADRLSPLALKRCQAKLENLLQKGEEAVACPQCHWIKDGVVRQYLFERYLWHEGIAILLALLGLASCLSAGWLLITDPNGDPLLLWSWLGAGSVLSLAVVAGLTRFRRWRQKVMETCPDPMEVSWLPPGIPSALYCNVITGEWKLEKRAAVSDRECTEWTEFRLGWDHFPLQCCGCLTWAADAAPYSLKFTEALRVEVPYCAACRRKDLQRHLIALVLAVCLVLVPGGAILYSLKLPAEETFWIGISGIVLGILSFSLFSNRYLVPVRMKLVDYYRGVAKVRFRNPQSKQVFRQHLEDHSCQPISEAYVESLSQSFPSTVP